MKLCYSPDNCFQRRLRKAFVLIFLIFNLLGLSQTKKALFVGNSYTLNNDLPQITASIASNMSDKLIYGSSAIANYSLQLHSVNSTTLNLIRQGGWDFVVLQEFSQYPSEPLSWVEANVYPYAQYLDNEINTYNPSAETMFYMTWGRKNGDADRCSRLPAVCTYIGMDDLTRERYMYMAQANHAVVSPVGAVWRYIRENYPSIELYQSDGSHPSAAGSYAAACCFYTVIYRKDPSLITYNYTLDPADALRIRTAAKMVVFNNLATWFIGTYNSFTITSSSGSGGSITPTGTIIKNERSNQTFTITPHIGYRVSDVRVDGVSVGAITSYTFSNILSNHTISATFELRTFTLTGSSGGGGSISPSGTLTLSYGSSQTYLISPNTGYKISSVRVDNVAIGTPSVYTFSSITTNHTIAVSFSLITNTITASAGTGGIISPQGNISVIYGSNQAFTISANTGYHISDVKVDNASIGPVSSYNFINVTAGHSISATFTPITYTITSSSGTEGSINPSGNITVNHGSNRTFTISPDFGFKVSDVKVDNVSAGAVSSYTFSNITTDHTISATFTRATYLINAIAGSGGSVNPSGATTVTHGTSRTFTITPATGYKISDVKVDNVSVGDVSTFTFSNITSNHSISASFAILTYTLTSFAGSGGSISSSGIITVDYGTSKTFNIIPITGYYISDVKVDNFSIGPVSSYTFNNVTNNHSISAAFSLQTFTLTGEAGAGGSVTPAGEHIVNYGSNSTYTITPDIGFLISDVKIDNISMGAISSYTFSNIASNHSVSAAFTHITFTIKSGSKSGGSLSYPGTTIVNYGTDMVYSITPDTGYQIDDVIVDNKSVGPVSSYTFSNITYNHEISASFAVITYTITVAANPGGSVNPAGKTVVNYGSDLLLTFTPDYGYRISDVKVNDISSGPVTSFTFNNIKADQDISVTFNPIPTYTISVVAGEGGLITPSGSIVLFEGSDKTYEISPSPDYRILDVIVDDHSLGAVKEFTFNNITSDHTLSVKFTTRIDVKAYPNPFAEGISLYIASPDGYLFDLSIADLYGKIIYIQKRISGNIVLPLNLTVPKGVYFLRTYLKGKKISIIKILKF